MIENIKNDIMKIYNYMIKNNEVRSSYPDHDKFQHYLTLLAKKYNLDCVTEHTGRRFFDDEKNKFYRGRIDVVYYKNSKPFISLEIDSGLKGTSIKKLIANDEFKYKIWFCYNKKVNTQEYYDLIDRIDKNKSIIYITP